MQLSTDFSTDFTEQMQGFRTTLQKKLDPYRYEHSIGVSFTAAALAMAHGADIGKAQLAGLLHDCAKCFSGEELLQKCEKHGVHLSVDELKSPAVIHAKYGAYLCREKYGIEDEDILNAVSFHTTGREDMSVLEKIIYIADYIEPLRDKADNLPEIRQLAFRDLDCCMYEILSGTVSYLEKKGSFIAGDTLRAKAFYEKKFHF